MASQFDYTGRYNTKNPYIFSSNLIHSDLELSMSAYDYITNNQNQTKNKFKHRILQINDEKLSQMLSELEYEIEQTNFNNGRKYTSIDNKNYGDINNEKYKASMLGPGLRHQSIDLLKSYNKQTILPKKSIDINNIVKTEAEHFKKMKRQINKGFIIG